MTGNIFGTGSSPELFKRGSNNQECCDAPNDNIMNCADVMACVNLNLLTDMDAPFIPYWNGTTFQNSFLYHDAFNTTTRVQAGTAIGSSVVGQTTIEFSVGGDQFNVTTDAGGYAEAYIAMSPVVATLGWQNEGVSVHAASLNLLHSVEVHLDSPITRVQANGIIASFAANSTEIDFAATGREFNVTTDGGLFAESWIKLTPTLAEFGASGTDRVTIGALQLEIDHAIQISLDSPIVEIAQNLITSGVPNLAQIDFTAGGNQVIATTDAGAFLESYLVLTPSGFELASQGGTTAAVGNATLMSISHSLEIQLNAPDVIASGNIDALTYSVNGVAGANFSGAVTNITVVDGIVTAAS